MSLSDLRKQIQTMTHADEHSCVIRMRHMSNLNKPAREIILERARQLTSSCRADTKGASALDAFLLEFGLSNKEGVALMCLAEALLRVPDSLTCDRLIAEKIQSGNWQQHSGRSDSLFVNASTWGLMLTGKVVQLDEGITQQPGNWLKKLVSNTGEPVIRMAMLQAMRIMGGQYVLGRSIEEAIKRGQQINSPDTRFSFDMLGEGARTYEDAQRYYDAYSKAIDSIGQHQQGTDVYSANGISVKLSALHPRYEFAKQQLVMDELFPRIKALCVQAKHYNIGLSIDAEEVDRLDLSLDIFERLAHDEELAQWQGLGFVLQAYQKRASFVASWLVQLAKDSGRRLMVRLVKGAYWDAEIKHAQEQGLVDYPVYTRKANTDLSYQFCAEKLLDAQQHIYPQFATHNAYTAALILEIAGNKEFEFQRLHGMGDLLYKHLKLDDAGKNAPIRVYAPVGEHKDLLPYLVRRLLENGANSSFVNRFLDNQTPVETLIRDVDEQVTQVFPHCHKQIPVPVNLYQEEAGNRRNSKGIDINSPIDTASLLANIEHLRKQQFDVYPMIDGELNSEESAAITNPAKLDHQLGTVHKVSAADIETGISSATQTFTTWNALDADHRATMLEKTADALEQHFEDFVSLIALEAGRTLDDGIAEVREAIDFCRYYANRARDYCTGDNARQGQGVFLCISPWNFPLAIFTGQIAAALAAGNCVLAKPAEQTVLIAYKAVELFHRAGVPVGALQLLPGSGSRIGAQLLDDERLAGVCFTGSTETAQRINQQMAARQGRSATLIAETGGQNAMIVDSTALPEQVVDDVISSAFLSAGQRCSALRVLFLQDDIADTVINMLTGAIASLRIGDPCQLSTDIGPVIDQSAYQMLSEHCQTMHEEASFIGAVEKPDSLAQGHFFSPHIFELKSISQLPKEIFGPVLHIIRYKAAQLPDVIRQINDTGYGLTLGIHSRIEMVADYIYRNTHVGNTYINRNMVGAVVGVNPFGGQGLSGTGPKAGGPNYLLRFTDSASYTAPPMPRNNITVATLQSTPKGLDNALQQASEAQQKWAAKAASERGEYLLRAGSLLKSTESTSADYCELFASLAKQHLEQPTILPGPTGEENILTLYGRGVVLCPTDQSSGPAAVALQVCAALVSGCSVIVSAATRNDEHQHTYELIKALNQAGLPSGVLHWVPDAAVNNTLMDPRISAVAIESNCAQLIYVVRQILAKREGSLIPLVETPTELTDNNDLDGYALLVRFVHEKTKTDNLVARGGDTQLFNLEQ